jgi:hypothetical protein
LRYAVEKRRFEITRLEAENRALQEESRAWGEQWEEEKREAEMRGRGALHDFLERGDSNAGIWEAIGKNDKKIKALDEEIQAIEGVMNNK